ncbi:MAG: sphingomyelin phosphodiesterase [Polyangiales bacterium]|nr:sphingomyelin phosphodiesterase [Sandaracinus sp.]MCB9621873.1 sphingomyelin phosphodiesterase [Sandaracinus sp.]
MATPLRLLTWNVKMLPALAKLGIAPIADPRGWWELSGFTDLERAKVIAKALAAGDWDVIVLQELFDEGARAVIRKALEKRGYATHGPFGNDLFNDDSGLFVASRLAVTAVAFHEYGVKRGPDALVDKGVCGALLRVNDRWGAVHSLFVFGTHLQAGSDHHPIRAQQLSELRRFVGKALAAPKNKSKVAAVALGDFNVVAESPIVGDGHLVATSEYRGLLEKMERPRDLFRARHDTTPGFTFDGRRNTMTRKSEDERERLDYVFSFDFAPAMLDETQPAGLATLECTEASVEVFRHQDIDLSDHFAVSVTVVPV